jgi:hypothetical protein
MVGFEHLVCNLSHSLSFINFHLTSEITYRILLPFDMPIYKSVDRLSNSQLAMSECAQDVILFRSELCSQGIYYLTV